MRFRVWRNGTAAERRKLFLVSVAVGEGQARHLCSNETKTIFSPVGAASSGNHRGMFARTMPLLTELGNFFACWFYKDAAPTGLSGRAPETFLVSVAVGEGECRHGGTAAFYRKAGQRQIAEGECECLSHRGFDFELPARAMETNVEGFKEIHLSK